MLIIEKEKKMGVDWKEGKRLVSNEEYDYRWWYYKTKKKPSLAEFNKKIKEIRKRTGKP